MRILALLTIIVGGSAWAENVPSAPVDPEPKYQSTFRDYRGFKDEPVRSWREANDEMRRLGGHMGHVDGSTARSNAADVHHESLPAAKTSDGKQP